MTLGALLALLVLATTLVAPAPHQARHRKVLIHPAVRAQLAAEWDSTNAQQWERGYCLAVATVAIPGDSAYLVVDATEAVPVDAGPAHVDFDCGARPTLHVHTPTTCPTMWTPDGPRYAYDACELGGPGKDVTWPSPGDLRNVVRRGHPFGVIQSGPQTFTVYYPHAP